MSDDYDIVVSVSSMSRFLQCRRLYQIRRAGWTLVDDDENLIIGRAVHAALEKYHVNRHEEEAFFAAFELLPKDEDSVPRHSSVDRMRDVVYAVLVEYFQDFKRNPMVIVSTETMVTVPLAPRIGFKMRMDGLVDDEGFRVLEAKTSGAPPGSFWPRYDLDFQTTGYVWGSRKHFELPIKGAVVLGLFKPGGKNPKAKVERRRVTPTEQTLANWLLDTIAIAEDMRRARETSRFPKSWQCINAWGKKCELLPFCSNDDDPEILSATHQLVGKE